MTEPNSEFPEYLRSLTVSPAGAQLGVDDLPGTTPTCGTLLAAANDIERFRGQSKTYKDQLESSSSQIARLQGYRVKADDEREAALHLVGIARAALLDIEQTSIDHKAVGLARKALAELSAATGTVQAAEADAGASQPPGDL